MASHNQRQTTDPKSGESFTQIECFTCGYWFRFGPSIYNGRRVQQYEIMICKGCSDGNANGFTTIEAAKIEAHLRANNLPVPARNEKGWLPLPAQFG